MTQSERDEMLIRLDVGINGNGGKGLNGRVDDLEDWKDTRPRECPAKPLSQSDVMKRRALEVAVMGLLLAIGQFAAKALGWW